MTIIYSMNKHFLEKLDIVNKNAFPELLQHIPDPPQRLFAHGNLSLLYPVDKSTKFLCVVGSRRYTTYGEELCQSLIKSLTGMPIIIVSGLALGIDGIAHRAALDADLPTIAVPGSGLHKDTLYPRSHYYLAEEIVEKGGLLISEYAPDMRASPWTFPMRNRIMAGMSHAVLIIEAEEDSGTLITAKLALDYNRDVGALPGSVTSENSRGTNNLIKRGASAITCPEDLYELLGFEVNQNLNSQNINKNPYEECSPEELSIAEILYEPKTREQIAAESKLPVSQLQVVLSILEIKGIINEAFGTLALRYPPPSAILRKNRNINSDTKDNGDKKDYS